MRLNLDACRQKFAPGNYPNITYKYPNYTYNGTIQGILRGVKPRPPLITVQGCKDLCGQGPGYYDWTDISSTITTWVLPVIGLLLQAPFESNVNFDSFLALARWVGNPIASISYVLWNIKVTGKCAMMLDMATPYNKYPAEDSHFGQMRDSLYILSVMNQYLIRRDLVQQDETMVAAEKLLRIALFGDELPMTTEPDLASRRRKLAGTIRTYRKKGVIPVFISTMSFLVALAISVELAFGDRATNQAAHNLALGLLLAFLPIFILSCIVDRNSIAAGRTSMKLNRLLASVRKALIKEDLRTIYGQRIHATPEFFDWIGVLNDKNFDDFFTEFAGQARIRWHYGVAHPLLCSFENSFMAEYGRGWLPEDNANPAKTFMRDHRDEDHRLIWFDPRMFRQIASSICIVCASAGGAFILSYFTPTVGLGCRSGGYLIYVVTAMFTFLVEMICWGLRTKTLEQLRWVRWINKHDPVFMLLNRVRWTLKRANTGKLTTSGRTQTDKMIEWWKGSRWWDLVDVLLRAIEVENSIWLTYIVTAQTIGSYVTCDCISSVWGGHGGYTDFETPSFYRSHGILSYWTPGTALSTSVLAIGLTYIVTEYCTQSHLATEDYASARDGLELTRRFRKYTGWFVHAPLQLLDSTFFFVWIVLARYPWRRISGGGCRRLTMRALLNEKKKKTLVWDWKMKERQRRNNGPDRRHQGPPERPHFTFYLNPTEEPTSRRPRRQASAQRLMEVEMEERSRSRDGDESSSSRGDSRTPE